MKDEHGRRNGGYFAHSAAQKDVQKTVVVPQIRYIAVCDATTSSPNFRVFRNCGRSAKCNKPKGWSMTLSRKRKLFFGFSCSLISKKEHTCTLHCFCFFEKKSPFCAIFVGKTPCFSLKNILLLLVYLLFSHLSLIVVCSVVAMIWTSAAGHPLQQAVSFLFLFLLLFLLSLISLLFFDNVFSFFIAFFVPNVFS